ncbi:glycoside hydrolase family 63 protein [Zasmidium cellare ATCC 36951]|uniref:Mannosyl-oligosaccharide glucosidase n=1 Tax=Zasmidium cellare ATCC 36951 TaxID=1080233 RepID=A0A6A6CK73_ZASCE|nr:glycoside hydrolase family 63 protein [Zasmidium cellare ATCC 36951]KAF2166352.1 glycoside hydrolase family 63 protein [Zasmidium cellare ATCC 36951]
MRPTIPNSVLLGLMWTGTQDEDLSPEALRHECNMDDETHGPTWKDYDPRIGGTQYVQDTTNQLDITTHFVRLPYGNVGDWAVRVKGVPRRDAPANLESTMVVYASLEHNAKHGESELYCSTSDGKAVNCHGHSPGLDEFQLTVQDTTINLGSNADRSSLLHSVFATEDQAWNAKSIFLDAVQGKKDSSNDALRGKENVHFIVRSYKGAFEFDIEYTNSTSSRSHSSNLITSTIKTSHKHHQKRMADVFKFSQTYEGRQYQDFAQSMVSNLLAGIGFFHGDNIVDMSQAPEYDEQGLKFWQTAADARERAIPHGQAPASLLSMTSSRTSSPHGMLGDEGFHLLVLMDWDMDLALDIVRGWLNLMDEDGWIASDQILGAEARSTGPSDTVQYPHLASPPTIFMVVEAIVDVISAGGGASLGAYSASLENPMEANHIISELYYLLKRHYAWFRRTQHGGKGQYAREDAVGYRWRGRTPGQCAASGMDDHPRPEPPHPGELHVDAISWVASMAKSLKRIAQYLGDDIEVATFAKHETTLMEDLNTLHWSRINKAYCDATVADDQHKLICHKGYVSLIPFALGLLGTNHPHLPYILTMLQDERTLSSPHGIRSLSASSPLACSTKHCHYRGPVSLNTNYLLLLRLLELSLSPGPHAQKAAEIYVPLRHNLIKTVFTSWRETGTAWKHYDAESGEGLGSPGWTGWTALVVKIMCMPDLKREQNPPDWRVDEDVEER